MENYVIKPDWKFKRVVKENRVPVKELAKQVGIHRNFISMYGLGRYNFDALEKRRISKALGLPENEVFGRNEVYALK